MGDVSMRTKAVLITLVLGSAMVFCSAASAGTALVGDTFPTSSGTLGPGYATSPVNTTGRYVFFFSDSDNLAAGINPDLTHLFRKDTQTGDVVLVNRADGMNGAPLDNAIYNCFPSGDGNLVAFSTDVQAVPADTDANMDVYLRNIQAGTTTLLTPSVTDDAYLTDISADGKYVLFTTSQALTPGDSNTEDDVYRMKLADGTSTLVSAKSGASTAGNDPSDDGAISGNGKWVVFSSDATDLVAGFSDNNGTYSEDIFLRDMDSDSTYLVSAKYNDATASANDGSDEALIAGSPGALSEVEVAFTSYAADLLDNGVTDPDHDASVYVRSMAAIPSELVSRASGASGANADSRAHTPSISDDGSRVIFSSDAENLGPSPDYYGVYMRDRSTDQTSLVSYRNSYAVEGTISGDGQSATWGEAGGATPDSDPDLASVFERSLPSGAIDLVSRPKGTAPVRTPGFGDYNYGRRTISATGRYQIFSSGSAHLPEAAQDGDGGQIYRRDLKTGEFELVSRASGANGAKANRASDATISSDGKVVAFTAVGQLVPADTNDKADVYVRNLDTDVTTLASRADGATGAVGDESSDAPVISGDGNRVAFRSTASNLGSPGTYETIYVRDLAAGKTSIISRAGGESGDLANADSNYPSLSYDGSKVVFVTYATNLSPDDPAPNQSVYLRNLAGNTTALVSRAPGLAGASLANYNAGPPAISGNGSRVAFSASDEAAVPATAPWPVGTNQVVVRNLADGSNSLASISSGGQPGDSYSSSPSLSRDGDILAFDTSATNLRDDIDNTGHSSVVVRDLATGQVSGPPLFGIEPFKGSSSEPVVSDGGDCIAYRGRGHNEASGDLGDIYATYLYVRSGSCLNPAAIVPKLSGVRLKPKKFRVSPKATAKAAAKKKRKSPRGTKISFSLNTKATVTVWIDRKLKGRKSGKKCVKATRKNRKKKACTRFVRRGKLIRKDLDAGKRKIAFSGRIGRKALKPGKYRMTLQAASGPDRSNKPARPFKVVRR